MESKNIVLIGMRGSGKTTIARLLSQRLGKRYIDTDDAVVERTGMPIAQMVHEKGIDYFRDRESEVLKELAADTDVILATGGGAVLRPENMPVLRANSVCIWLKAPVADLVARTAASDPNRFPLTDKKDPAEEVMEILDQRESLYGNIAHETINTDGRSEEDVVREILLILEQRYIE